MKGHCQTTFLVDGKGRGRGWRHIRTLDWSLIQHVYTSLAMIPMKRYIQINIPGRGKRRKGKRGSIVVGAKYGVDAYY